MVLAQRLVLLFSRSPEVVKTQGYYPEPNHKNPLKILEEEYPDLSKWVTGKKVLDFGCGSGEQSGALVKRYGADVVGVDVNPRALGKAIKAHGDIVRFVDKVDPEEKFDVVISQNAMEHFADPVDILNQMKRALRPGGIILMTFGPPWYAPYGAHLMHFCKVPWVHLLFPEKSIMSVIAKFRGDNQVRSYEDMGMNRMSLRKFARIVKDSGLVTDRMINRCVKKMTFFQHIPVLRELMVNHVTAILRKT